MHGDVVCTDLGATLRELAETMTDQEVGSIVVTEMGQVVGIVTERDIVAAVGEGLQPDAVRASDIMSEGPLCADPDDTVRFVVQQMMQANIQHVPVVGSGRPVGMLSIRDLFRALAEQEQWITPAAAV
jgi:CBS domain-containing protein